MIDDSIKYAYNEYLNGTKNNDNIFFFTTSFHDDHPNIPVKRVKVIFTIHCDPKRSAFTVQCLLFFNELTLSCFLYSHQDFIHLQRKIFDYLRTCRVSLFLVELWNSSKLYLFYVIHTTSWNQQILSNLFGTTNNILVCSVSLIFYLYF